MPRTFYIGIWVVAVLALLFLFFRFGNQLLAPILQQDAAVPLEVLQNTGLPAVGGDASEFELADLSGKRVRLSDFAHTPLLLTFWSTREGDARDQIKILDDWMTARSDAPFQIVAINSQEDKSIAGNFVARGGYGVSVLLDKDGAVGQTYGIRTLPASFFIDGKGTIRGVYVGVMSQQMIAEMSERILR